MSESSQEGNSDRDELKVMRRERCAYTRGYARIVKEKRSKNDTMQVLWLYLDGQTHSPTHKHFSFI